MRDRIRVVCRPGVAAGFRLAGLDVTEAKDAAEGARCLEALLEDPDAGVVLVEEDIQAALGASGRRSLAGRALPVVVPFPSPSRTASSEGPDGFIAELLRQTIGYRVRLG